MKKKSFAAWIAEYILLLFIIICLVTAGLMISNIVISAVKPFVNPAAYPVAEDTGVLTEQQLEVFHGILDAAEAGTETVTVQPLTQREQREITTHLGLYFGSMEGVFDLVSWGTDTATLNLELFRQFTAQKSVIDARVDEAVAHLYEGSDRFKLWQICKYLSERIDYTDGVRDTIDGLNGQGMCCTYAMLFYKMATRLGIQTYICYGYAGDSYHAWNMVELDGERFYYDPTWYDNIVSDFRYVHNDTPWGRELTINRK